MRGGANAHLLQDSTFLFEAVTVSSLFMISNESSKPPHDSYKYPYMMKIPVISGQHNSPIKGEVFEVDSNTLKILDKLEEHPVHYLRQDIQVKELVSSIGDIELDIRQCQTYFLENVDTIANIVESMKISSKEYKIVPGGDWRTFID